MEGIKAGKQGIVQLLSKTNEFKETNANDIQEWFFKKKVLMLAFRLIQSGNDTRCQKGDGVFWFKRPDWIENPEKHEQIKNVDFILFTYDAEVIAFARLKNVVVLSEPISVGKDEYYGYFIIYDIKIFDESSRINEQLLLNHFKPLDRKELTLKGQKIRQGYYCVECVKELELGESLSKEVISEAERLSKAKWFWNIEEFCKF